MRPRAGLASVRRASARSSSAIAAGMSSRAAARRPAASSSAAASSPSRPARSSTPPELAKGAARLLQVMPGQVLGARCPLRVGEETASERLVKRRSRRLRDPGVGSIADETVGEAVPVLPGGPGAGRTSPARVSASREDVSCRPSSGVDSSASARGSKRRPTTDARSRSSSCCRGSWSRRAASTASIVGGIDSSPGAPWVATAASCSRNRGISLGDGDDPVLDGGRGAKAGEEHLRVPVRERGELDGLAPRRPGTQLEQLRPAEPHDRHRRVRHERREVVHEIVERRLGPVRVLDDEHERLRPRVHLDEAAYGPEDLVGGERGGRQAARRFQPLGEELLVLLARQSTGDGLGAAGVPEDLHEGPVGRPAVRHASAGEDGRASREPDDELVHEPGLPDSGVPDDGRHDGATLGRGALDRPAEPGELVAASDEWAVEAPRDSRGVEVDGEDAPGENDVPLPLRGDVCHALERRGGGDEQPGRRTDEDLVGARGFLEALGGVHDVTGHERLAQRRIARDGLSGRDPGPGRQADPELLLETLVQLSPSAAAAR